MIPLVGILESFGMSHSKAVSTAFFILLSAISITTFVALAKRKS